MALIARLIPATGLALAFVLALYSCVPRPAARRAVMLPDTPAHLPISSGLVVGNTLYVAGAQAPGGGIGAETRGTLDKIKQVVETAGFSMSDVVAVDLYLADANDFAAVNEVYRTYFTDPKPARTPIQAGALINGALIEISAVAVK